MRKQGSMVTVAGALIACSAALYYVHYLVFRDAHHIFLYLLGDLAFVPLEVLLVVIVIERLLAARERRAIMNKLNMVIGAFFSELGMRLLGDLTPAVEGREEVRGRLAIAVGWTPRDFQQAIAFAHQFPGKVDPRGLDLIALRDLLVRERDFLVRLLENPYLLEHDRFTDLLWAIFHLTEELVARPSLRDLPASDLAHLSGDLQRVYSQLAAEWVAYAEHLRADYPFLFSLLVRTQPLQDHPSAVVSS
jgi:hypothetical protein